MSFGEQSFQTKYFKRSMLMCLPRMREHSDRATVQCLWRYRWFTLTRKAWHTAKGRSLDTSVITPHSSCFVGFCSVLERNPRTQGTLSKCLSTKLQPQAPLFAHWDNYSCHPRVTFSEITNRGLGILHMLWSSPVFTTDKSKGNPFLFLSSMRNLWINNAPENRTASLSSLR